MSDEPESEAIHRQLTVPPTSRPPVQTVLVTVVLAVFGIALVVQSSRWAATPAYGLLLKIASADAWGCVYLVAAIVMGAAIALRRVRLVSVMAHTLTVVLLTVWEVAFIIRYATDHATTVVNCVSWATYMFLAIWSAMLIDRPAIR